MSCLACLTRRRRPSAFSNFCSSRRAHGTTAMRTASSQVSSLERTNRFFCVLRIRAGSRLGGPNQNSQAVRHAIPISLTGRRARRRRERSSLRRHLCERLVASLLRPGAASTDARVLRTSRRCLGTATPSAGCTGELSPGRLSEARRADGKISECADDGWQRLRWALGGVPLVWKPST